MTAPRQYATAGALRSALEARLLDRALRDLVDLQRLRRQVAFDRLLARMFAPANGGREGWVLKGSSSGTTSTWTKPFIELAGECNLDYTIATAQQLVATFWTSALASPETS